MRGFIGSFVWFGDPKKGIFWFIHIDGIIIDNSAEADLVILGFNLPSAGKEQAYVRRMEHLTEQLPTTLLVHAGFDVDLFS